MTQDRPLEPVGAELPGFAGTRTGSSRTRVAGRYVAHIAVLNHHTDRARVDEAVAGIRRHAADLVAAGR